MAQYATTIEGDAYFAGKLHMSAWDEATEDQRNRALIEASTRIDQLKFRGSKTSEAQALAWPRVIMSADEETIINDGTTVPARVKNAACEIAYALLDGVEPDLEYENLAVSSEGYSSARSTYTRPSVPEHFAAGIPSFLAWQYLKPLLGEVSIKLSRVT
jgi:hypothetical protein